MGPDRLIVHVDNVRPDEAAQFEAARVRFVGDLKQRGVDDRRGHDFEVGETRFYSVVPFRTFELTATRYPFERRAYSSSYGTGKLMVFWLGDGSKGARPPIATTSCVLRSESTTARFMETMSIP